MEEAVEYYFSDVSERDADGEEGTMTMGLGINSMAESASPKAEDAIRYGFYGKYYDDFYLS